MSWKTHTWHSLSKRCSFSCGDSILLFPEKWGEISRLKHRNDSTSKTGNSSVLIHFFSLPHAPHYTLVLYKLFSRLLADKSVTKNIQHIHSTSGKTLEPTLELRVECVSWTTFVVILGNTKSARCLHPDKSRTYREIFIKLNFILLFALYLFFKCCHSLF